MTDSGVRIFAALGTTAAVAVTEGDALDAAVAAVRAEIDALDRACSRFRADSELSAINSAGGRPVTVSALCLEAVQAALRGARVTGGLVDPTVGGALQVAGYDRDFSLLDLDGPAVRVFFHPVPGWRSVWVDPTTSRVRVPAGVHLDLGATAKAWCADRAAAHAASLTGAGVLVGLGGDLAAAGPAPDGGWAVRVTDRHDDPPDTPGPVVGISSGGLATSSTTARRWLRGGREMHHLIDPSTGAPAAVHWRTATVAAGSCLDANIASCAAIVLGPAAVAWLRERHLPARLVDPAGRVTVVAGWLGDRPEAA